MTSHSWSFIDEFDDAAPMVLRGRDTLSARDVRGEAVRVRSQLAGGHGPIFLYCEDAGNFLAGLLGALSASRDVFLPGHAAPAYLQEIGATSERLLTDMEGLDAEALVVSIMPEMAPATIDKVKIDETARIGFLTSGSTGAPKLCIKTQRQILLEAVAQLDFWGAPSGPVLGTVSHQHIYGLLFRLFWPLMAGQPIFAQQFEMWEQVVHHAASGSSFISSPAHLARIPGSLAVKDMPQHIFSSGGPLSFAAAQSALAKFDTLPIEVLGSTETGGVAWRQQGREDEPWTPLPDVEVTSGDEGALCVRSPFTGEPDFVAMGDRVTIGAERRFTLHARIDRIVKVEGKRVSLPHVEGVMRKLPSIVDVAVVDLPDRGHVLGAAVILSQEADHRLKEIGPFRFSRELRKGLATHLEPMERPKVWRFLLSMPQNAQGKRPVAELRNLFFNKHMQLPKIITQDTKQDEARFELVLDPELVWFDGHFPEQPVLAGVAQIHIASMLAEKLWGFIPTGKEMARVKFRRLLIPGDHVTLVLVRHSSESLKFTYLIGDEVAASGTLKGMVA